VLCASLLESLVEARCTCLPACLLHPPGSLLLGTAYLPELLCSSSSLLLLTSSPFLLTSVVADPGEHQGAVPRPRLLHPGAARHR
jgi:hypothetical protein